MGSLTCVPIYTSAEMEKLLFEISVEPSIKLRNNLIQIFTICQNQEINFFFVKCENVTIMTSANLIFCNYQNRSLFCQLSKLNPICRNIIDENMSIHYLSTKALNKLGTAPKPYSTTVHSLPCVPQLKPYSTTAHSLPCEPQLKPYSTRIAAWP